MTGLDDIYVGNGHAAEFDERLLYGYALGCRIRAVHQYLQPLHTRLTNMLRVWRQCV